MSSYGKYRPNTDDWKLCRIDESMITGYTKIQYLNNTLCSPARFTPYGIIHSSLVKPMKWEEFTEEEQAWIIEGCLNE